jgi:glutamate-1-semialdehyde 2,1-aminomutase
VSAPLTDSRSAELYQRALRVLAGGVNSPVRAMAAIGRDPIFIERGVGAELIDVDGNRYVDYVCSWGPLILGHARPEVVDAIVAAAERGSTFGAPTLAEVSLAEEVARRMPAAQMLRMTSSGTEATMTAVRLARAATGREQILKFAGAYHGHLDSMLAQAGSGLATYPVAGTSGAAAASWVAAAEAASAVERAAGGSPSSPGVPAATTADTIVVPWNDPSALTEATEQHRLAAIVAEPLPANMGLVPPAEGFLELLRARAGATGALLVLDEVISGFRVARGGAQERAGVVADLVIMGKVIGGGLPAGAVGGSASLLELLAPAGEVYQAGTLSGNPLAMAAGLATLALLDESAYLRLGTFTEQLAAGLREAAGDHPVQVVSAPGLLTVFFSERPVRDLDDAKSCDLDAHASWCRGLLARGVYPPPSQFEAWFPSLAHGQAELELTLDAAAAAFKELR